MDIGKGDQLTVKVSHIDEEFGPVGYPVEFDNYENYDGGDVHVPGTVPGEVHSVTISCGSERLWVGRIEKTLRNKSRAKEATITSGTRLHVKVDKISASGTSIGYPIGREYRNRNVEFHLPSGDPGEELEVVVSTVKDDWAKAQLTRSERKRRQESERKREEKERAEREKRIEKKRSRVEENNEEFMQSEGERLLEEALSHDSDEQSERVVDENSDEWDERVKEKRGDLSGKKL